MRRFGPVVFIVLAALIAGVILVEVGLAVTGYAYPAFFRLDEQAGARHRANAAGWFRNEAEAYLVFNEQGIRVPADQPDHVFSARAPADTLRIAVFGDSFTEGLQVKARERYTHIVETALNRCEARPKRRVELVNFAVSGMGQARELELYESVAVAFDPDIVLVAVAENDFGDNLREFAGNPFNPYWTLDGEGRFARDVSFRDDPAFRSKLRWRTLRQDITARSRVLQLLTEVYVVQVLRRPTSWPSAEPDIDRRGEPLSLYFAPPSDPPSAHMWTVFTSGMRHWAEFAKQNSDVLMVTSVPAHHAMRADAWDRYRASYGARGAAIEPDRIDQALSDFATEAGFAYFPVIAPMRSRAIASDLDLYFHAYSGINWAHMNALGHQFMGEELAGQICRHWQSVGDRPDQT